MNPFELFQSLKPQILQEKTVMDNLRIYAFTERLRLRETNLKPLGAGRNNLHWRMGKVGDIWLATREYVGYCINWPQDPMQHCENYIAAAVQAHQAGKRVPIICGGIKGVDKFGARYFLLVEDLTQGGAAKFVPAPRSGGVSGTLDGVEIFHDFDTDSPYHPSTNYLREELLLVLENIDPSC